MPDPSSRAGTFLGDYRLDLFLAETPTSLTWLAEQASVRRPVVLVELKPSALGERDAFLADVRAKAAVDHPLIGSVYEAVSQDDQCHVALERLPGPTLADRLAAREALKPVQLANVLRRMAEAEMYLETSGIDCQPLGPESIHLDSHGVVRIANRAKAGARSADRSSDDILLLGTSLRPLVADGHPGSSRLGTLLAWMRGEELGRTLSWQEVHSYAAQIEQQLVEVPAAAAPPTTRAAERGSRAPLVAGAVVALVLAVAGALFLKGRGAAPVANALPPAVTVAGGSHPAPDGGGSELTPFEISSHEVTIGEYAEFLADIARRPAAEATRYDAPGQPASKTGHEPEDWTTLYSAARSGGQWQGRQMSLTHPVVNVDWWDAAAFCNWKVVKLPTQEQWFAALRDRLDDPARLNPAGWSSVTDVPPTDRTPTGLLAMAGSVSEWTREPALNPANPLGAKSHVIIGASFLKPAGGALAREWTDDLLLRRPDLGFRVVRDLR